MREQWGFIIQHDDGVFLYTIQRFPTCTKAIYWSYFDAFLQGERFEYFVKVCRLCSLIPGQRDRRLRLWLREETGHKILGSGLGLLHLQLFLRLCALRFQSSFGLWGLGEICVAVAGCLSHLEWFLVWRLARFP